MIFLFYKLLVTHDLFTYRAVPSIVPIALKTGKLQAIKKAAEATFLKKQ